MVFLGLEKPVEYQRLLIFNPVTANMVLNTGRDYINAVYNEYKLGLEDLKEFNKTYGDFTSPILKDMDWYDKNVTGKVRNFINNMYANGIDPLRSAEGRAAVSLLIYSMPVGDINKLRLSADNARKYNEAVLQLRLAGLYNPETAALEGVPMDLYSTLGDEETPGNGVWGLMSPTPYHNMAQFSKDYFDNIKPFERSASKNGISYTVSEINEDDLHRIADAHFNDLVKTPQGLLMYKLYLQQSNNDPKAARQAFNDAVVSGNLDRLYYSDNYQEANLKHQQLAILRASHALARDRFNWEKQRAAAQDEKDGVSQWEQNYNDSLANAASDGYTKYDPSTVNQHYGAISKNINNVQNYFGLPLRKDPNRDAKFEYRYTKPVDVFSVLRKHGGYKEGEKSVSLNRSDIEKLRSHKDVITNTQGNWSKSTSTSKKMRKDISNALEEGREIRMFPRGTKYGALSKYNTFDIDAGVDVVIYKEDGSIDRRYDDVYWDTGWGTNESISRPEPMQYPNLFQNPSQGSSSENFGNVFPTMWGASSVLPGDTRGTKGDYNSSPSTKLGTSYK